MTTLRNEDWRKATLEIRDPLQEYLLSVGGRVISTGCLLQHNGGTKKEFQKSWSTGADAYLADSASGNLNREHTRSIISARRGLTIGIPLRQPTLNLFVGCDLLSTMWHQPRFDAAQRAAGVDNS